MIGYNISKINELLDKIGASYKAIGEAMSGGWDTVTTTLGNNWIGEDEEAYTKALADRINELYGNCKTAVNSVAKSIIDLGESWKTFQKQNVIEGSVIDTITGEIGTPTLEGSGEGASFFDKLLGKGGEIIVTAPKREFNAQTDRGIKSASAGKTCYDAVTDYVKNVRAKVEGLYSDLETNTAFLGAEQSASIKNYLTDMGKSIADLTTCVKTLRTHLETLIANVAKQEGATKDSISAASTSIDGVDAEAIKE